MNTMTLTAKSQCTFNKQLMSHMGTKPGDTVSVTKLPDGSIKIQARPESIPFMSLQGCIETNIIASDEQINQSIAQSYARSGLSGLGLDHTV
jgi:hypothetical protein